MKKCDFDNVYFRLKSWKNHQKVSHMLKLNYAKHQGCTTYIVSSAIKNPFLLYGTITGPLLGQYDLFSNSSKLLPPKMFLSSLKRIITEMQLLQCLQATGDLTRNCMPGLRPWGSRWLIQSWGQGHGKITKKLPLSQSLIVTDKKFVLRSFLFITGPFVSPNGLFSNSSKILIQTMSPLGLKRINKKCDFHGVYKQLGPDKKLHAITLTLESRSWKGHQSISPALNFDCAKFALWSFL